MKNFIFGIASVFCMLMLPLLCACDNDAEDYFIGDNPVVLDCDTIESENPFLSVPVGCPVYYYRDMVESKDGLEVGVQGDALFYVRVPAKADSYEFRLSPDAAYLQPFNDSIIASPLDSYTFIPYCAYECVYAQDKVQFPLESPLHFTCELDNDFDNPEQLDSFETPFCVYEADYDLKGFTVKMKDNNLPKERQFRVVFYKNHQHELGLTLVIIQSPAK